MPHHTDPATLDELSVAAHRAVDRIIEEYRQMAQRPVLRTVGSPDNASINSIREMGIPDQGPHSVDSVATEACEILQYRMPMNHPRAMCFIPAPMSPLSWLGNILTTGFNPFGGSWLQSSGASAIEDELITWLAERVGLPRETAGGVFLSGGSMANLTGLTLARDTKLGTEMTERACGVAYMSTQTHSSVSKALKLLGFSDRNMKKISTDAEFRLDVVELRRQIEADIAAGMRPFAVIASLGTTNTGSIDDLDDIAEVAREFDIWMHVDGAYGASVVLSGNHRHLAKGLEKADSLSWDAHKWLFQSYDTGLLLVKSKEFLLRSFVNNAEYLQDALATSEKPNFWDFSPELTRPSRGIKLWLTLRTLGTEKVGEMIDHGFHLAEAAEARLRSLSADSSSHWRVISPAQMAIVVFRHEPPELLEDEQGIDEINRRISKEAIATNTACILTTQVAAKTVLRIVAIHPDLTEADMLVVIDKLDAIAIAIFEEAKSGRGA